MQYGLPKLAAKAGRAASKSVQLPLGESLARRARPPRGGSCPRALGAGRAAVVSSVPCGVRSFRRSC